MIFGASFVYGAGLLVAGLAQEWHNWYYGLILPVAVAGGTVMTLSWALLFKLMPPQHRGAISGPRDDDEGPRLAGRAAGRRRDDRRRCRRTSAKTDGYEVLWPVCAVPVLAAIPLVASLIGQETR